MLNIRLKLLAVFALAVFINACNSYQFNDYTSDFLKSKSQKTSVVDASTKKPQQAEIINNTKPGSKPSDNTIKKQAVQLKIASVGACKNINLDAINVNNLVFDNDIEQCLSASKEFYNYLLFLYKHNVKVADKMLRNFVEYRAEHMSLNSIVEIANERLLVWLNRNSEVEQPNIAKPSLTLPKSEVILEKGEFETSAEFKKRIASAKGKITQVWQKAQQEYKIALDKYDKTLAAYHQELELEKKQRKALARQVYLDIINEEVRNILGEPFIGSNLVYDADKEVFYANLSATNSNWQQPISIAVSKEVAPYFKKAIGELTPILGFDINEQGELFISYLSVRFDFQDYTAKIEKQVVKEYMPVVEVVRI